MGNQGLSSETNEKQRWMGVSEFTLLYHMLNKVRSNFPLDCTKLICSFLPKCIVCNEVVIEKCFIRHAHYFCMGLCTREFKCVICGGKTSSDDLLHEKCRNMKLSFFWRKSGELGRLFEKNLADKGFSCDSLLISGSKCEEVRFTVKGEEKHPNITIIKSKKEEILISPPYRMELLIHRGNIILRIEYERVIDLLFRIDMLSKIFRRFTSIIETTTRKKKSDVMVDLKTKYEKFSGGKEIFFDTLHEEQKKEEIIHELRNRCLTVPGLAKFFFEIHGLLGNQHEPDLNTSFEFSDIPYFRDYFFDFMTRRECEDENFRSKKEEILKNIKVMPSRSGTMIRRPRRSFFSRLHRTLNKPIVHLTLLLIEIIPKLNYPPYSSTMRSIPLVRREFVSPVVSGHPHFRKNDLYGKFKPVVYFDGVLLDWNEHGIITPMISFSFIPDISTCCVLQSVGDQENGYLKHLRAFEVIRKYNTEVVYKSSNPRRRTTNERNSMDFVNDFLRIVGGQIFVERYRLDEIFSEQKFFRDAWREGSGKMSFTLPEKFFEKLGGSLWPPQKFEEIFPIKTTPREYTFQTHLELDQFVKKIGIISGYKFFEENGLEIEWAILKSFDRAFWLKHLRNPFDDERSKPLEADGGGNAFGFQTGCPFGDPRSTRTYVPLEEYYSTINDKFF